MGRAGTQSVAGGDNVFAEGITHTYEGKDGEIGLHM
jgi:hypothetical protein